MQADLRKRESALAVRAQEGWEKNQDLWRARLVEKLKSA
jgi:hypothetical protein